MQYKGEAKDETSLSVRVGNQGIGVNFTLIPAGEQSIGNAVLTNVCRSRGRGSAARRSARFRDGS